MTDRKGNSNGQQEYDFWVKKSKLIIHIGFHSLPNSNKIRGNRFFFRRRMWDESVTGKKELERQKTDGRKVNDLTDPRKLNTAKPIVRKTEKQHDLPKKKPSKIWKAISSRWL